jgi:Myotubularin protein
MWFARFVSSQRTKTKRVNENTFYALIQYFAIVLFECKDCEDFLPAKHLMSLCFTYYQEVEVPGCEPYREYLFNYLRDQPIWHNLRFWNATLFYALQKDKVPKTTTASTSFDNIARKYSSSSMQLKTLNEEDSPIDALKMDSKQQQQTVLRREPSRSISESSLSTSSSTTSSSETGRTTDSSLRFRTVTRKVNRTKSSVGASAAAASCDDNADVDERKLQDNTNVAFSQLG